MSEIITLDKLRENLDFFNKMYDAVRLIDPIQKKVLEYRDKQLWKTGNMCYAYWGNGKICDNCISMRAFREKKSFIKLESSPNEIILLTALPIDAYEQPVVLELFKNATDSMLIGTGEYTKNISICSVLNDINSMVVIDHLTSLYNRRFLDDRLPVDIIKATLNKKPMSVIFIDINSMKTINDTFGHIEGDNALKLVGKSIKQSIRNTDWAARYGGDEFFICLNNMTNEDANIISEKISNRITSEALHIKGNVVKITVSAGVATMLDKAFTADEIIKLADEKMYEAKKRNK